MPKSVLCYFLDKGQYFNLESVFTQSCFPNKDTNSRKRVKQFIILEKLDTFIGMACIFDRAWHGSDLGQSINILHVFYSII